VSSSSRFQSVASATSLRSADVSPPASSAGSSSTVTSARQVPDSDTGSSSRTRPSGSTTASMVRSMRCFVVRCTPKANVQSHNSQGQNSRGKSWDAGRPLGRGTSAEWTELSASGPTTVVTEPFDRIALRNPGYTPV
jgi:hypothetical protein